MAAGRGQSRADASDFGLDRARKNHTDRVEKDELGMLADGRGDRLPRCTGDEVREFFDGLAHRDLPDGFDPTLGPLRSAVASRRQSSRRWRASLSHARGVRKRGLW